VQVYIGQPGLENNGVIIGALTSEDSKIALALIIEIPLVVKKLVVRHREELQVIIRLHIFHVRFTQHAFDIGHGGRLAVGIEDVYSLETGAFDKLGFHL